ncbi:MAG: lysophospholipid acyltransferase family protein [Alphaproteobacteria bacterium]
MVLFLLLCLSVIPTQGLLLLVHKGRFARIIPYLWMSGVCAIFGIKVRVKGKPHVNGQVIYLSNHLSYLDIPVIGSILKTRFVSRKDAGNWVFMGWLVKLGQTAFVERSRSAVKQDSGAIGAVIEDGQSLIIFPEGTSTDGQEVLPFKSSLFSLFLLEDKPDLRVQPMTLQVLSSDKRAPKSQADRDIYAWHKDLDTPFFVHLWLFAQRRGAEICLTFHDSVRAHDFENRKTLAKACHETVSNELQNS